MNLNKVHLIGRLTQDPETRTTPAGQTVANFTVATNRVWTDQDTKEKQEKTEFHNVVAWRKLAEICGRYLTKGQLVFIEGRLETRSWQDQNGVKKYRTEIIAENMQMGPRAGGSPGGERTASRPAKSEKVVDKEEELPIVDADSEDGKEEINVKDIPF